MAAWGDGYLKVRLLENMELIKFPPRVISEHVSVRDPRKSSTNRVNNFSLCQRGSTAAAAWRSGLGRSRPTSREGASCALPV